MAETISKEQIEIVKEFINNPDNYVPYKGKKILSRTELGRVIAEIFGLSQAPSVSSGLNKFTRLLNNQKDFKKIFDGFELRRGDTFVRDKPLIIKFNNDSVFRDQINNKLKATGKKDFFDLTKDEQNRLVSATEVEKKKLKQLPKNFVTRPELAKQLKLGDGTLEAYQLGRIGNIGDEFRQIFKPIVIANRGTFFDSTNLNKKIKAFNNFRDRPGVQDISVERVNLFASDPTIQKFLNNKDKKLFSTEDGLKTALKVLGKGSTPHEAASAMSILARAYNGEKFRNLNITPDKAKGKFIFNNFSELALDNPWVYGLYDEGLRQVDRDLGKKVGTFAKFKKDYTYQMNKLLKEYKINKKFNINEVTSVKASYNNKIAPYAAFVDLTQADVNQKALRSYQGDLSKALAFLDKNKNNQAKVLEKIENFNKVTRGKKLNLLTKEFGEAGKDVRLAEIVAGTDVESVYGKGDLDRWKSQGLDLQKLADEKGYFLDVKGARPFFDVTKDDLKKSVQGLINTTEDLPKNKQILICNFLSNGGLPGDCKRAIAQDPEKAAQIISKVPADTKETAAVKDSAQKLIRLFRGEANTLRSMPAMKSMAKNFNVPLDKVKKLSLSGQWFTSDPRAASSYTNKLGKTKYVDVTPKEFLNFKKYVDRVNKTKDVSGKTRFPVNTTDKLSIVPKYKLDEFEKAGKLKSQRNIFKDFDLKSGYAERPPGVLTYDSVLGGFVDSANPNEVVGQNQLKTWAEDNPIKVEAGTELPKANKSVLKTVGRTLAHIGAPLPTALIDSYFINKQMDEGKSTAEIAKDPLNWLGLATMEPLTKMAGANAPGGLNAVLRLGLNPATIRGITRFAGLPGLAISTAMTAYDQYKKYQNEEGFVYNLFNKEGN